MPLVAVVPSSPNYASCHLLLASRSIFSKKSKLPTSYKGSPSGLGNLTTYIPASLIMWPCEHVDSVFLPGSASPHPLMFHVTLVSLDLFCACNIMLETRNMSFFLNFKDQQIYTVVRFKTGTTGALCILKVEQRNGRFCNSFIVGMWKQWRLLGSVSVGRWIKIC